MIKLKQIYEELLKVYGEQGWWPLASRAGRKDTDGLGYSKTGITKPESEAEQLEICIGAILAQNTSWKNAQKAITSLNRNSMISIGKLAAIKIEKLALMIKPSGYYNRKSKKLKAFAKHVSANHGGSLRKFLGKSGSELRKELLSIHGIGPETADSMLLYAAGRPSFVIDAYTKRIFTRIGISGESSSYDEMQRMFENSLPNDAGIFNQYHALIVELGKRNCRKTPECASCPLRSKCRYYANVFQNSNL